MNLIFSIGFVLLCLGSAPARAQEESWDARLAGVSGDVTVVSADGSPEASGEADMPLEEGDRVVVAEGGSAEVSLDGSSLITVRERSDFKIEKTAAGDSSFFLSAGSILAKIQKLGARRLRVRTPSAVAAVRGTEFGVEVDGEESHVGVFDEGKVEVTGESGGEPELLISNQETSVRRGGPPAHAAQLRRFMARRAQMRAHGRRIAVIKAKWRALPPALRRETRVRAMERMRENRKGLMEKRGAMRQRVDERRRQAVEQNQRRRMENLRKMDERRKNINRGGRRERR
ncbi:MAG: FecR domain-containing protein [Elusimicrobia bacterium]|nr:FecR domain-containing protein [Elusimicrobiota bacterium]